MIHTPEFSPRKLRKMREQARLTQEVAAELATTSKQTWSLWETGKHRPHPVSLSAMAKALKCRVDDLME